MELLTNQCDLKQRKVLLHLTKKLQSSIIDPMPAQFCNLTLKDSVFDDCLSGTLENTISEIQQKSDKMDLLDGKEGKKEFKMEAKQKIIYRHPQWPSGDWVIIYKQKSKIMYSKNADFTNLDLFSCQDLDNYGSFSPDFNKPMLATGVPTFGNTSVYNHEQFFYQKSTQNLTGSYQISFQKDFMKQHQAVFERELQNYMESFRIYSNETEPLLALQNQLLSKPQTNKMTCTEFISANRLSISYEQTQSFVKKFNTYDKLSEFLNCVVSACPKTIAVQLIHISKELLDKYQSVKIENPSQNELLSYAAEISENPQFVELANLKVVSLNKSKEAKDLLEKSRYFMEVYCATTMLVIAQYFQNPYNSEEMGSFKRRLSPLCSEDESQEVQESSTPLKKRKFSF